MTVRASASQRTGAARTGQKGTVRVRGRSAQERPERLLT